MGRLLILNGRAFTILKTAVIYVLFSYGVCLLALFHHSILLDSIIWLSWPCMFARTFTPTNVVLGSVFCGYGVSLGLKMISYHARKTPKSTLTSFLYFLLVPTMCYQDLYPRTKQISVQRIFQLTCQYFVCLNVLLKIIDMSHTRGWFMGPLSFENLFPYCTMVMAAWIVSFYGFFHCYLNVIAELVMYEDRRFYDDWWNATTVQEFWRKWNVPMHTWFKSHIHLARFKRPAVFMLSAILHEYVVMAPSGKICIWPLVAIAAQCPLVIISNLLPKAFRSNTLNWFLLWLFGPLALHTIVREIS